MRNDINSYINAIFSDNKQDIAVSDCCSVAEYIILSAESSGSWNEFFSSEELDGDATTEQIEELKDYLNEKWDLDIQCPFFYSYQGKEVFLADPCDMPEDIKPISNESGVNCQAYELKYYLDYQENNDWEASVRVTYLEAYGSHYAENGADIIVGRVVNAENEERYLYDWILVSDLEDVNEELKEHEFDENDIPNELLSIEDSQVLDNIKAYELASSGYNVDYQFSRIIKINDEARLYLFQHVDIKSSAIAYGDGTTFVMRDWQTFDRPESKEDIEDYEWVSASDGRTAIVMNGLPRLF